MAGGALARFVAVVTAGALAIVSTASSASARVVPGDLVDIDGDRQARSFDIAHNPEKNEFLAVWRDFDVFDDLGVMGVLLDADGSVIGAPFEVAPQRTEPTELVSNSLFSPSVAYNPATDRYLVVVLRNSANPATPVDDRRRAEVFGRLLTDTGAPLGTEVPLNPPLGSPGQDVCVPRSPDVTVDGATGGYVLVYARTYESADDLGDVCEGLAPAASVTVVQALDGALGRTTRADFPVVNSAGPAVPRVAFNPITSNLLVTQPYEGAVEVGPTNRDGMRFAAQVYDSSIAPVGPVRQVDVDPVEPVGTGPVDDARPVADPLTGNWFVVSSAPFFGPNWTNLLGPTGQSLRAGTRLDNGRPTSVAAAGDGTFVFSTEAGDLVHVRADGSQIHPARVFPPSILMNSAVAIGPVPSDDGFATGVAVGLGPDGVAAASVTVVPPGALPLTPARLLDTRQGAGFVTTDGAFEGGGAVASDTFIELEVAGRGGVPLDAEAVLLNVAAVGAVGEGFVTIYPCDAPRRPITANVNYRPTSAASAAALSRASQSGTVCLYTSRTAHLVVDVNGYVPAGGSVESLVPARLLESRTGSGAVTVDGASQGIGRIAGGQTVQLPVIGRGGVDVDADAVIVNVAAIRPSVNAFLTVYPCGESRPQAANLNAAAGTVVNNLVAAKVSDVGTICVYTSASTDVVVDVAAFVPALGGLRSIVPARLLETRSGSGDATIDGVDQGIGPVPADGVTTLAVAGRGGVAADATGAMLNVAAIRPEPGGFMTVYPCDAPERPQAANLNFAASRVVSNAVFVKLDASGQVCIYSTSRSDLAIDVVGFVVDT